MSSRETAKNKVSYSPVCNVRVSSRIVTAELIPFQMAGVGLARWADAWREFRNYLLHTQ